MDQALLQGWKHTWSSNVTCNSAFSAPLICNLWLRMCCHTAVFSCLLVCCLLSFLACLFALFALRVNHVSALAHACHSRAVLGLHRARHELGCIFMGSAASLSKLGSLGVGDSQPASAFVSGKSPWVSFAATEMPTLLTTLAIKAGSTKDSGETAAVHHFRSQEWVFTR